MVKNIIDCSKENKVPVYVDPKFDNYSAYKGVRFFKPNLKEYSAIAKEEEFERLIQKEAEFKEREEKERKALEEYSRKAREDEQEQSIAEQIEEAMKSERIKPDFTEVIEPELTIEKPKNQVGLTWSVTKNYQVLQQY